jgi:hypothetical protein
MYAIKQAMLLSGALPLADITIYYMDIRAFGKGYEQFFQNAKAMGIEFVKGKIAAISQASDQNVTLKYEAQEEDGRLAARDHDLVILSLGMVPDWQPAGICDLATDSDAFIHCAMPQTAPTRTTHGRRFRGRCGRRSQGHRGHDCRSRRRGHGSLDLFEIHRRCASRLIRWPHAVPQRRQPSRSL